MYGGVISYLHFLGNVGACIVLPPGIGVALVSIIKTIELKPYKGTFALCS
jgi:hypothetical protein